MTRVEMRYCRGTKDLAFTVASADGRYHQVVHGDSYQWEDRMLVVIKRQKVQFRFPNAVFS